MFEVNPKIRVANYLQGCYLKQQVGKKGMTETSQ